MSFLRFQYFLTVAEELNFQKAAQRLFISQQALSTHIQKLEAEYDVTLFERKPRVRLTLAGERMYLYVKRLLETRDLMAADLSGISQHASGKITIGISRLRGRVFLPRIWRRFHALYPNINFLIKDTNSPQMERRLMLGEIDLYIGVNAVQNPQIHMIPLASEQLCLIVHRSVLERHGIGNVDKLLEDATKSFDVREFLRLADFPYILLSSVNQLRITVDRFLYDNNIVPNIAYESDDHSVCWDICVAGGGISFVSPAILFGKKSFDKDMCIFPIDSPMMASSLCIAHLKSRQMPKYYSELISISESIFEEYDHSILHRIPMP